MASTSKGIAPDRLTGIFGSQYIAATATGLRIYAFIAQEDTVITVIKGGDASLIGTTGYVLTDYTTSMGLGASVTLKQGALLTAPSGEIFTEITMTSGKIIGYK
jgi:hypothetical protein